VSARLWSLVWAMRRLFWLAADNHTTRLAMAPPPFGENWPLEALVTGSPSESSDRKLVVGDFQQTNWMDIQAVLIHRMARHPDRTLLIREASYCVFATPPQKFCVRHWHKMAPCPQGLPIIAIDGPDADTPPEICNRFRVPCCPTLWNCRRIRADRLVRVTSNVPLLHRRLTCRVVTVPYLAHARTGLLAGVARQRPVQIAYCAAVWGHSVAETLGFSAWRRAIRNACHQLRNMSQCTSVWPSFKGSNAAKAVLLYSRSQFCLQPPGDTIARSAIVDAVSVGCIPVFFHPGQVRLWPLHWNATTASILFDFTLGRGKVLPRSAVAYQANATAALRALLQMPQNEVKRLQLAVAQAAPALIFRRSQSDQGNSDAVDTLVSHLQRVPFSKLGYPRGWTGNTSLPHLPLQ